MVTSDDIMTVFGTLVRQRGSLECCCLPRQLLSWLHRSEAGSSNSTISINNKEGGASLASRTKHNTISQSHAHNKTNYIGNSPAAQSHGFHIDDTITQTSRQGLRGPRGSWPVGLYVGILPRLNCGCLRACVVSKECACSRGFCRSEVKRQTCICHKG
jgi:hypothetical protein